MMSPRTAHAMIGLGLLEAVAEDDLLAHADADDADGDGISGRPNHVWDPTSAGDARSVASAGRRTSRHRAADLGRVPRRHRHHLAAASRRRTARASQTECTAAIDRRRPGGRSEDDRSGHVLLALRSRCPRAATSSDADVLRGKTLFDERGLRELPHAEAT